MYGTRIFLNRLAMFSCSHCMFSSSDNSYKVTVLLRKIMLNMATNLLNYFLFYSTFTIKTLRCHLPAESNVVEMCTVHSQTSTIKNIEHYNTQATEICSLPQKAPKYIIHQCWSLHYSVEQLMYRVQTQRQCLTMHWLSQCGVDSMSTEIMQSQTPHRLSQ